MSFRNDQGMYMTESEKIDVLLAEYMGRIIALERKLEEPRWDQAALDVLMLRVDQLEHAVAKQRAVNEALIMWYFGDAQEECGRLTAALREATK